MDLDACGVQRDGFDPDTHDLRTLQLLEHAIQDASFGPAIHARVNRVPVAEAFGQSAPLATMFGHIEDRIDHLQIAQADVATLPGQAVFNGSELFGRDLHVGDFLAQSSPSPLVLTRPSLVSQSMRFAPCAWGRGYVAQRAEVEPVRPASSVADERPWEPFLGLYSDGPGWPNKTWHSQGWAHS